MNLIDANSLDRINFQEILNTVEVFSPYGKNLFIEMKPYERGQEDILAAELDCLEHISIFAKDEESIIADIEHDLSQFKDISTLLKNCQKNYVVDEVDCYEIKCLIFFLQQIMLKINSLPVFQKFHLTPLDEAYKILDPDNEKILSFHFYNSYSQELCLVRETKKSFEDKIALEKNEEIKQSLLTQRADVILKEIEAEYKVRCDITRKLSPFIPVIFKNIAHIAQLDIALAKVRFFHKNHCIKPLISQSPKIEGTNMVNLRAKEILEHKGKKYTPISIKLLPGTTVITGANMGGKSVTLRTIAESLLFFHYGFFVPCEKAEFSLMDFIRFISDDMQDYSRGISSFGAEIFKLKGITPLVKKQRLGFLVFDEFARGTNPQEGQKFVKALVSYLNSFPSISLITSHFEDVVTKGIVHYQVVGLKNVSIEKLQRKIKAGEVSINAIQEHMDYRLELTDSTKVPHEAFHVARLIGLDPELEKILEQEYN